MGIQSFTTGGTHTFNWPDDITHVELGTIGGGAGSGADPDDGEGGGGGGEARVGTLYRLGESSLSIHVGAGGAHNNNGVDTTVTQGATVVIRAKGGTKGTGQTGGAGGTGGTGGTQSFNGGNGGNAFSFRGAGGGSSASPYGAGEDGENAATPGNPEWNGTGGLAPRLGGNGGNGSDDGHGQDGQWPGGGGGGGAADFTGGIGGHGLVVVRWGVGQGATLFSQGCGCCGQCDLMPTDFPQTANVAWGITPEDPPSFDPLTYDAGEIEGFTGGDCCGATPPTPVTYDGGTHDAVAIDQSMLTALDGEGVTLTAVDFSAGYDGVDHFCLVTYQCGLLSAELADDLNVTRACGPLFGHPIPTGSTPTSITFETTANPCVFEMTSGSLSMERSGIYANAIVTLKLRRRFTTGKYYFDVGADIEFLYSEKQYSHIDGVTTLDSTNAIIVGSIGGTATGGPYDTPEEAIAAAALPTLTVTTDFNFGYGDGINSAGLASFAYVQMSDVRCCPGQDQLPACHDTEEYEWHHVQSRFYYSDTGTLSVGFQ